MTCNVTGMAESESLLQEAEIARLDAKYAYLERGLGMTTPSVCSHARRLSFSTSFFFQPKDAFPT